MGRTPRPSNEDALRALRESLPSAPGTTSGPTPAREKHERRIITVELREPAGDDGWHWVEHNGDLRGIIDAEDLANLGELHECDQLRVQVEVGRSEFRIMQVVPGSLRSLTDKQRRERVREIRRANKPREEKKVTHLNSLPPPGVRRVIRATVGMIDGSAVTWHAINGEETMTSASPRANELSAGQTISVVLEERDGTLHFVDFVAHTLHERVAPVGKPKLGELALDAMYNLEPGDVVDAWLAFDGTPGGDDIGREGKTRPAIFIAKRGTLLLLRGITDGEASYAKRLGMSAIRDWRDAGLKKPSVVMSHDQEVDIIDVWARRGRLSEFDRKNLGIG